MVLASSPSIESAFELLEVEFNEGVSVQLQHGGLRVLPLQTRLLPNYPNPFNPETWIPYELAETSAVQVRIFDLTGKLVRVFELGMQSAGAYLKRGRALHWDGRDRRGEPVASGIYAVTFQAGEFSATRRLVVVK